MKSVDPRTVLKRRLSGKTYAVVAEELGIKAAYLSDIMAYRRDPGPRVLKALGLTKRVTYHFESNPGQLGR